MESPPGQTGSAWSASPPPQPPPAPHPNEERNWGLGAHLSALSGFVVPLGNLLGPLVVWLISKDKGPFADHHGKEAVNFQIGVTIALAVLGAVLFMSLTLAFLVITIPIVVAAAIMMAFVYFGSLILAVLAGIAANRGEWYRYPMSFRFIH